MDYGISFGFSTEMTQPMQPEGQPATIRREIRDGAYVLTVQGELDLATAAEMEQELRRAEASAAAQIIVDLSGLRFIDCTGIRALLSAEMASRADSSRLVFLRGSDQVEHAFVLTGADKELRFLD